MKKIVWMVLVTFCFYAYSMRQEQNGYLKLFSADILKLLHSLVLTEDLNRMNTLDELLEKLQELKKIERLSSPALALYNQLSQIKALHYTDALKKIKELSKDQSLASLFNNPDFNRIIIYTLFTKSNFSLTPQQIADELNTLGAHEWLRQLQFLEAVRVKDSKIVLELLSKGIDINARDMDGYTALLFAASQGSKDIVEMLLKAGADVNAQNIEGQTALMRAAHFGLKDIVKMLITHKANVNIKDKRGRTALTMLNSHKHKEIAELLVHSGAKG